MADRRLDKLLPVPRWPSQAEAEAGRWFTPVRLGPITARHRTWVPAMVPWRATEDGFVTPNVIDWYTRFARGEPGVLVVEATGIRDVPSGPLLRVGHDRYVDGLARLGEAVRRASGGRTRLFIQIIDFLAIRRRPAKDKFFQRFLALTPAHRAKLAALDQDETWRTADEARLRGRLEALDDDALGQVLTPRELEAYRFGDREQVNDVHLPHIAELPAMLPDLFAQAARRCARAGFDGVELHFAHAYTMASFLSARNQRGDGYGGSPENRVRLPLEVYQAARAAMPSSAALGCRFLSDEIIEGGSRVDDALFFAQAFARAGMDFLSLSRGGKFEDAKQPKVGWAAYPYTGPSGHECMPTTRIDPPGPFGRNLEPTAQIKRALVKAGLHTPVVACGGIASFWQAEAALARGDADVVASARQTLADPDWFLKLRHGRGEDIRRCYFTNYCEGLDQAHRAVTCQRWDRGVFSDDATASRAADGRRLVAPPWFPPQPDTR